MHFCGEVDEDDGQQHEHEDDRHAALAGSSWAAVCGLKAGVHWDELGAGTATKTNSGRRPPDFLDLFCNSNSHRQTARFARGSHR
jgi:hypothetical protein